jgi:AcrR family transcriptional regulator
MRASPRRHSADERRELVLEAARREFAALGLGGATGEGLSYRAGISHPYLLRLFGSKRELFLEVVDRLFDDLVAAARAEASLNEALGEDGSALLLQCFAACGVDEVRLAVQRRMGELHEAMERAGSDTEAVFAGILLNGAVEAMRLEQLASRESWARQLLDAGESS